MAGYDKVENHTGSVLTELHGAHALPRYFAQVFAIAKRLAHGRLDFVLDDGRRFRAEGPHPGPVAEIHIHSDDVFARLIREGDLGFSESYLEGGWSTPDLQAFMDLMHAGNDEIYDGFPGMIFVRAYERLRHLMNANTKRGSKKNISYHYDLGNDFYRLWLDDTMTYSSALFETGQESLEAAQTAKYAAMVDALNVAPGDHVLEIGCGWGGFAEYAAKERALRVTGLTISQEQFNYASERIEKAGLSSLVDLKVQDYRDERAQYDGIASIEMFEAVGEKYWPVYFERVRDCLKPGKRACLQIITLQEKRFETYRKSVDFIQKYIFPGGMLPSMTALKEQVSEAELKLIGSREFGLSYSQTLRRWHATFNARWPEAEAQGFDARFKRMWNFYLTSCAGSFQGGNRDVTQMTVARAS